MDNQRLRNIEAEVEHMVDGLDEPVDENIKPLVVALNYAGFETTASCQGHLDRGCPYPWVDVGEVATSWRGRLSDFFIQRRMRRFVKAFNAEGKPNRPFYVVTRFVTFRLQQFPNLTYPEGEPAVSATDLTAMQADANKLADFLIQKTEASASA